MSTSGDSEPAEVQRVRFLLAKKADQLKSSVSGKKRTSPAAKTDFVFLLLDFLDFVYENAAVLHNELGFAMVPGVVLRPANSNDVIVIGMDFGVVDRAGGYESVLAAVTQTFENVDPNRFPQKTGELVPTLHSFVADGRMLRVTREQLKGIIKPDAALVGIRFHYYTDASADKYTTVSVFAGQGAQRYLDYFSSRNSAVKSALNKADVSNVPSDVLPTDLYKRVLNLAHAVLDASMEDGIDMRQPTTEEDDDDADESAEERRDVILGTRMLGDADEDALDHMQLRFRRGVFELVVVDADDLRRVVIGAGIARLSEVILFMLSGRSSANRQLRWYIDLSFQYRKTRPEFSKSGNLTGPYVLDTDNEPAVDVATLENTLARVHARGTFDDNDRRQVERALLFVPLALRIKLERRDRATQEYRTMQYGPYFDHRAYVVQTVAGATITRAPGNVADAVLRAFALPEGNAVLAFQDTVVRATDLRQRRVPKPAEKQPARGDRPVRGGKAARKQVPRASSPVDDATTDDDDDDEDTEMTEDEDDDTLDDETPSQQERRAQVLSQASAEELRRLFQEGRDAPGQVVAPGSPVAIMANGIDAITDNGVVAALLSPASTPAAARAEAAAARVRVWAAKAALTEERLRDALDVFYVNRQATGDALTVNYIPQVAQMGALRTDDDIAQMVDEMARLDRQGSRGHVDISFSDGGASLQVVRIFPSDVHRADAGDARGTFTEYDKVSSTVPGSNDLIYIGDAPSGPAEFNDDNVPLNHIPELHVDFPKNWRQSFDPQRFVYDGYVFDTLAQALAALPVWSDERAVDWIVNKDYAGADERARLNAARQKALTETTSQLQQYTEARKLRMLLAFIYARLVTSIDFAESIEGAFQRFADRGLEAAVRNFGFTYHEATIIDAYNAVSNLKIPGIDQTVTPRQSFANFNPLNDEMSPFAHALLWLYRVAGQFTVADLTPIDTVPSAYVLQNARSDFATMRLEVDESRYVYQLRVAVWPRNEGSEPVTVYSTLALYDTTDPRDDYAVLKFAPVRVDDRVRECVFAKRANDGTDGDDPLLRMTGTEFPEMLPAFLGPRETRGVPKITLELYRARGWADVRPEQRFLDDEEFLFRTKPIQPYAFESRVFTAQAKDLDNTFQFRVDNDDRANTLTLSDFQVTLPRERRGGNGTPRAPPPLPVNFGGSTDALPRVREVTREDDPSVLQDNDRIVDSIAGAEPLVLGSLPGSPQVQVLASTSGSTDDDAADIDALTYEDWFADDDDEGGAPTPEIDDGNGPSYYDRDDSPAPKRVRRTATPPPAIVAELERTETVVDAAMRIADEILSSQSSDDESVQQMAEDAVARIGAGDERVREAVRDRVAAMLDSLVTNPLLNRPSEGSRSQNRTVEVAVQRSVERLRIDVYTRAARQLAEAEAKLREALATRSSAARGYVLDIVANIREQLRVVQLALEANAEAAPRELSNVPANAVRSMLFGSVVPAAAQDPFLVFDYAWPFLPRGSTPIERTPLPAQLGDHLRVTSYFYPDLFVRNGADGDVTVIEAENGERVPLPLRADFTIGGRYFFSAYDYYAFRAIESYLLETRRVFADELLPRASPKVRGSKVPPITSRALYERALGEIETVYASYAQRDGMEKRPERGLYKVFNWLERASELASAAIKQDATEEQAQLFALRLRAASINENDSEEILYEGKQAQLTQNAALFEAASNAVLVMRERPEVAAVAFNYVPAPTSGDLMKRRRKQAEPADLVPAVLANRNQQRGIGRLATANKRAQRYAGAANPKDEQQLPGAQLTRLFVKRGGATDAATREFLVQRFEQIAYAFDHVQDFNNAARATEAEESAFDRALVVAHALVNGLTIDGERDREFFANQVSALDLIEVNVVPAGNSEPVLSGFALVVHLRGEGLDELRNDLALVVAQQVGAGSQAGDLDESLVRESAFHLLRCVEHATSSFELRERALAEFYGAVAEDNREVLAALPPVSATIAFARSTPVQPALVAAAGRRYAATDAREIVLVSTPEQQSAAATFDTSTAFAYRSRLARPTAQLASSTLVSHSQWQYTHFRQYGDTSRLVLREAPLPYMITDSTVPATIDADDDDEAQIDVVAYQIELLQGDAEPLPLARSDWYPLERGFVNGRVSFLPINVSVQDGRVVVDHDVAKVYDWQIESSALANAPYAQIASSNAESTLGERIVADDERQLLEVRLPLVTTDTQVALDPSLLPIDTTTGASARIGVAVLLHTAAGARAQPDDYAVVLRADVPMDALVDAANAAEAGAVDGNGYRPGSTLLQPTLYGQRDAMIGDKMLHRVTLLTETPPTPIMGRAGIYGAEIEFFANEAGLPGRVTIGAVHLLDESTYRSASDRRRAAANNQQQPQRKRGRAGTGGEQRAPRDPSPRRQSGRDPSPTRQSGRDPSPTRQPPKKTARSRAPSPPKPMLGDGTGGELSLYSEKLAQRTSTDPQNTIVTRVEFWLRSAFVQAVERTLSAYSSFPNFEWTLFYNVSAFPNQTPSLDSSEPVRLSGALRLVGTVPRSNNDIVSAMEPAMQGRPNYGANVVVVEDRMPVVVVGSRVPLNDMLARVNSDEPSFHKLNVNRGKLAVAFSKTLNSVPDELADESGAYVGSLGLAYLDNGNADAGPLTITPSGAPQKSYDVALEVPNRLDEIASIVDGSLFIGSAQSEEADELYLDGVPIADASAELRATMNRLSRAQKELEKQQKKDKPSPEAGAQQATVLHAPYEGPDNMQRVDATSSEQVRDALLAGSKLPSSFLIDYDLSNWHFGPALAVQNGPSGVSEVTRARVRRLIGDRYATLRPDEQQSYVGDDFVSRLLRFSPNTAYRLRPLTENFGGASQSLAAVSFARDNKNALYTIVQQSIALDDTARVRSVYLALAVPQK